MLYGSTDKPAVSVGDCASGDWAQVRCGRCSAVNASHTRCPSSPLASVPPAALPHRVCTGPTGVTAHPTNRSTPPAWFSPALPPVDGPSAAVVSWCWDHGSFCLPMSITLQTWDLRRLPRCWSSLSQCAMAGLQARQLGCNERQFANLDPPTADTLPA